MSGRTKLATVLAISALVAAPTATASAAEPAGPALAKKLAKKVTVEGVNRHLIAFQRLADRNGGNRAALTPGYNASVDYVAGKLRDEGFIVTTPTFTYDIDGRTTPRRPEVGRRELPGADPGAVAADPGRRCDRPAARRPGGRHPGLRGHRLRRPGLHRLDGPDPPRRLHVRAEAPQRRSPRAPSPSLVSNNVAGPLANVTLTNPGKIPTGGISQADGTTLAARRAARHRGPALAHRVPHRAQRHRRDPHRSQEQRRHGRFAPRQRRTRAPASTTTAPAPPHCWRPPCSSASRRRSTTPSGSPGGVPRSWASIGSEEYVQPLTFEQQLDIALYLNFDMVGSPERGATSSTTATTPTPTARARARSARPRSRRRSSTTSRRQGRPDRRHATSPAVRTTASSSRRASRPVACSPAPRASRPPAQAAKWGGTAGVAYDPCYHRSLRQPRQPRPSRAGPQRGRHRVRHRGLRRLAPRTSTACRRVRSAPRPASPRRS